jgi:malto-oligosyltrehalose trehalohydrolase
MSYKILNDNEIKFELFAPDVQNVDFVLFSNNKSIESKMIKKDHVFEHISNVVKVGDKYYFKIDGNLKVPDPLSKYQPLDVNGPTEIFESKFDWEDDGNWKGLPWNETVIYELHIGTFSPSGTFQGVIEKLDYLKSLGITALELMPIADFSGTRNWGYDCVLLFAPDSIYGNPDDLRELVKQAHKRGLQVFLDVVYNHFGPEGNYLSVYAKSEFFENNKSTPWGEAINYNSTFVRNFYIQNAFYWLEEFHIDGLRFDAVHSVIDESNPHLIKEIAQKVQEKFCKKRHIHLMLENDDNDSDFLKSKFVAQWNDDVHHALHVALTKEENGYYADYSFEAASKPISYYLAKTLCEGFAYQGEKSVYRNGKKRGKPSANLPSCQFINFLQNHDQVGNRTFGERISHIVQSKQALQTAIALNLLSPSIPLLFMGEEWSASTPFLYFCDFEESLSNAVFEGRKNESNDENLIQNISNPAEADTFEKSKLNWEEQKDNPYNDMLSFYKSLLKLRAEKLIPAFEKIDSGKKEYTLINDYAFHIKWHLNNSKFQSFNIVANMSDEKVLIDTPQYKEILYLSNAKSLDNCLYPWQVGLYFE